MDSSFLTELGDKIDERMEFFADRSRDQGGRYEAGQGVTGVDDFRAAHGKRKRTILGAGAAIAAGAIGGTKMGRAGAGRVANGIMRAGRKVLNRDGV